MPDLPIIQTRDANGIDHLFLNQPDRHNALSPDMIVALHAAFTKLGEDPSCRLVCLRATKAAATSFLLSPDARFICGSVLFVDGGHDAVFRPDQV